MFDANMRYISKGERFFCKLHSLTQDSPLAPFGARRGSVILCEMLDQTTKDPRVKFIFPDGEVIMKPVYPNIHTWAVYEGSENLTDFINDDSKQMAEQYLQQLKEGDE